MKFKVLVNEHGQILHQQSSMTTTPAHGQMEGSNMWIITEGFVNEKGKYWDYSESCWRNRSEAPNEYSEWIGGAWVENSTMKDKIKGVEQVKMRNHRNFLLSSCDWGLGEDSPLTDSQKTELRTYRQQLRDVPASYTDILNAEDVVWPTKPTFL